MRLFLIAAFSFAVTSAHAAEPYFCKDFTKDYRSLDGNTEIDVDKLPSQFLRASGFILGVYYAHEGEPFDGDDSGMAAFEKKVVSACSDQPDRRVSLVALELIRQPKDFGNAFIVSATLPEAQITGGKIEYEGVLGTSRIIYQIHNATDRIIGVSVRCSLYDENDQPLGQGGGWTNGIPPQQTVVGEGMAQTSVMPVKSDCRIVSVNAR